jgi:hypothetical protein
MSLSTSDVFAILAVLIALSAYLAVVRQRIYDKSPLGDFLESYLKAISIGDILLVTSIICFLTAWLLKIEQLSFLKCLGTTSEHWITLGTYPFLFGLFWLISLHVYEWSRTFGLLKLIKAEGKKFWLGYFVTLLLFGGLIFIVYVISSLFKF